MIVLASSSPENPSVSQSPLIRSQKQIYHMKYLINFTESYLTGTLPISHKLMDVSLFTWQMAICQDKRSGLFSPEPETRTGLSPIDAGYVGLF